MLTALLALGASVCFALGAVLQQRVAMRYSDRVADRASFIVSLARRPVWLLGLAAMVLGFFLHAAALASGQIVVVEPILSLTLVLALPLGVVLSAQTITRRDVLASLTVAIALGSFLVLSNPAAGVDDPSNRGWAVAIAACLGIAGVLTVAGVRRSAAAKAALVGAAAGVLFGLHSALTKTVVTQLGDGVGAPFGSWEIYFLLALSWIAMTVTQISFQAGDLPPAISTQSIGSPVVAVALGLTLFDERIHDTGVGVAISFVALMVMLCGLLALASRPAERPVPL